MKIVFTEQGSPEWHALRTGYNTASEAPAMLGASKYQTRDELLRQKATGIAPEVSHHQQVIFDRGHRAEEAARVILADDFGEAFYPITAVSDDGKLLASLDGITMDDVYIFEHKLWNEKLANQVRSKDLEPHYYWQLEQQLLVTGAEIIIFVCSDGTKNNWVQMDYFPVPGRAKHLQASWSQFDADKAVYVSPVAEAPAPTGRAPQTLPALFFTLKGEVTASTLPEFKEVALTAIRSVNRELSTDQHFADAEKAVKWCEDVEIRVVNAKKHALSQTATIDQLFKTMDDISAEARQVRLELDKLIKARKMSLKNELLTEAQTALRKHVAALNAWLGRPYMPPVKADFAGAIYGKKSLDSIRAAINAELANGKIEASTTADRIYNNLATLQELASAHKFLFVDMPIIVLKANDDLTALVKTRIAAHQATEMAKEEATRARIRAEEQAKAEAASCALAREAQRMSAIQDQAERIAVSMLAETPAKPTLSDFFLDALTDELIAMSDEQVLDGANAVAIQARGLDRLNKAKAEPPLLKLGQIGERLGFSLTGEFLKILGFEPVVCDKNALLFHEADFPLILTRLVAHIQKVQEKQAV